MRRILFAVLTMLMLAVPAVAADGKAELGLIGEFVQTDEGDDPWSAAFDLLLPIGAGHIVIGPTLAIGNDDTLNRLGGALEWNLTSQKGGPFIGAAAYYFQKDVDGLDRYTVVGRGGFKVNVGKGAAVKAYAFQVVDGRGADETDLGVALGIIAKF